MAATFTFDEDTGSATGSPAKGTTRTSPATDVNWKNSGVVTNAYGTYPITAGNNSFQKVIFGHFSGSFTQISAGLFSHTAGVCIANETIKGIQACVSDATRWIYTTPSATTDANLTTDMTAVTAIASGISVYFGATGPEATGKAATMTTNPCYTNYLTTQKLTSAGIAGGDDTQITLTLQYNEF
jgi:hypothetical protein